MLYLDGYNICFTLDLPGDTLEEERESLLSLLRNRSVTVVFDAPEFSRTHRGDLEIVYADQTADTYILSELERLAPRRATLVTADRALATQAKQFGAKVIAPSDYIKKLRKRPPSH
jgi:predicted RNA-binding protein with PIN domain